MGSGGEGIPVVRGRPGQESRCGLSESAGEEARAQMKAMMEQFRATETAMRLLELKVNVCYLGLTPKHVVGEGGAAAVFIGLADAELRLASHVE